MEKDLFGNDVNIKKTLKEQFICNPFSVINLADKKLQVKKKKWIDLGIKSEIGRDTAAYGYGGRQKQNCKQSVLSNAYENIWSEKSKDFFDKMTSGNSVSVFNPVLAEIIYNWFCNDGGTILDPFAGGSVRGIVANYLGYKYTGIDIRQEQIDSNRQQAMDILPIENQPQWYVGDSNEILNDNWNTQFDMVMSCPPYADLEVYSDLEGDISNKSYNHFLELYESIIAKSCKLLKMGGYACFVVGDIRDKKTGEYKCFIADTIKIFTKYDMVLWNDIILLSPLGNAGIRANMVNKKVVKVHQNALVFYKPF